MEKQIQITEPFTYADSGMWMEECEKFDRNRIGIGFQANVTVISFEEKKLLISLSPFPEQFKKYQEKLMGILSFITKYGFWFINNFDHLDHTLFIEDIEDYTLKYSSKKQQYTEMLLNLLVQEGQDIFLSVLMEIDTVHAEMYELQNSFYPLNREWVRKDGLVWEPESYSFVESDASAYSRLIAQNVITEKCSEQEKNQKIQNFKKIYEKKLFKYVIVPFRKEYNLEKDTIAIAKTQYYKIYYSSLLINMVYDIKQNVWTLEDGSIWDGRNWMKDGQIKKYGNPEFWQTLLGKIEEGESFASPFEKMKAECQTNLTSSTK